MSATDRILTGLQKAGVLMVTLGAEASAKVFDCLTPEERDQLGSEIAKLRKVDDETRKRVLEEFNLMIKSGNLPGPAKSRETGSEKLSSPDLDVPLKWLETLESREVAAMISKERPQNIALVLSRIAPQTAADILMQLSDGVRNQVAHRMSTMKPVSEEALEAVDQAMRQRAGIGSATRSQSWLSIIAGSSDRAHKTRPEEVNFAPERKSMVFNTIEDILELSNAEIREAVLVMDFDDLCLAMRVAGDDLRNAVLRNVSEEAGMVIRREINSTSQIRVREIERAQARVVESLNKAFGEQTNLEAPVGQGNKG